MLACQLLPDNISLFFYLLFLFINILQIR